MRKNFMSGIFLALAAVCLVVFLATPISGQKLEAPSAAAGLIQDWSMRHVYYARLGSMNSMMAAREDPRAILSWRAADREAWKRNERSDKAEDKDEDGEERAHRSILVVRPRSFVPHMLEAGEWWLAMSTTPLPKRGEPRGSECL